MWGYIIAAGVFAVVVVPTVQVGMKLARQYFRPKIRGAAGEAKVDRVFRKFKGKGFARTKDIMLPVHGKTSQIDNLLISRYGIFVVETKNYAGIINGQAESPSWFQTFVGSKQKPREFLNPIWQNAGHIRALKELLSDSYPNLRYHNIVVFSDDCALPKVPGVVPFRALRRALECRMKDPPVLTNKDVAAIKDIIEQHNIRDVTQRTEHVERARKTAVEAKTRQRMKENRDMALYVQNVLAAGRDAPDYPDVSSQDCSSNQLLLEVKIREAAARLASNRPDKPPQEKRPER